MKVYDIISEATKPNVFVFGDSIAVGIQNAGNAEGSAKGGENADQILARIESFIASSKNALAGATVILSSGASNSTYERKSGEKKNLDTAPIARQISVLKAAGAKHILLVGTGSGVSKWMTNRFGEYRINFKDQQVNEKLAGVASSSGIKFLGPLEAFDPGINSSGDGIHMSPAGYKKLFQTAVSLAPEAPTEKPKAPTEKPKQAAQAEPRNSGKLQVPSALWHGEDTRAIQQALIDLGYKLPNHGADGFFGPETARAVRKFQQDHNLKVDGDPGPETVGKLNSLTNKKGPVDPQKTLDKGEVIVPDKDLPKTAPATRGTDKPKQGAMIAPREPKQSAKTNFVDPTEVSRYLKSKKMSGNHRIGILANIQGESSFNSANQTGDGGESWGFFQWNNFQSNRRNDMVKYCGPDWKTNWRGQIDFALQEPAGQRYLATKFKTYEQAIEQWVRDFERPADPWGDTVKRIAMAHEFVKNKV